MQCHDIVLWMRQAQHTHASNPDRLLLLVLYIEREKHERQVNKQDKETSKTKSKKKKNENMKKVKDTTKSQRSNNIPGYPLPVYFKKKHDYSQIFAKKKPKKLRREGENHSIARACHKIEGCTRSVRSRAIIEGGVQGTLRTLEKKKPRARDLWTTRYDDDSEKWMTLTYPIARDSGRHRNEVARRSSIRIQGGIRGGGMGIVGTSVCTIYGGGGSIAGKIIETLGYG